MGLSSSKSKTTQQATTTTAPNPVYSPQIDSAAATLRPAYDAAQANITTNLMPRVNSVLDYYSGTLNGDRLTGNPYLQGVIDKSNSDISNRVSSRFASAGRYGSGNYTSILARELADNENKLRYGDYAQERAYQNQAASGLLSGVAASAALPQAAAGTYADQIRTLLGGYTTGNSSGTSTTQSSPSLLQVIASAAAAAGKAAGG